VFAKPYVNPPLIMGINSRVATVNKCNIRATDVTTTGMNVSIYQVLGADLASGTYVVDVSLVGWKKA